MRRYCTGLVVFGLALALAACEDSINPVSPEVDFPQFGHIAGPSGSSKIAFASDRTGDQEIYVMDSDGSNVVQLTHSPGWDAMPAWSPDGNKIAFQSDRDGNREIYVMDADGSN